MNNKNYFTELESLRGLAALMVCFFHVTDWNIFGHIPVVFHFDLFVDFFFVLSGFVITFNFSKNITSGATYKNYLVRRFFRIYPLFLIASIPYFIVSILKTYFHADLFQNTNYFNLRDFVFYITLVYKWGLVKTPLFNQPAWSISVEWLLYIVAGLIFLLQRSRKVNMAISIVMFAGSFVILAVTDHGLDTTDNVFLRGILSFFVGSLICYIFTGIPRPDNKDRGVSPVAGLLYFSITIFCLVAAFWGVITYPAVSFVFPFLFALFIYLLLTKRYPGWVLKFLHLKYVVYLGTISFSVYLIHPMTVFVTEKIFKKDALEANMGLSIAGACVYVAITIVLAVFSYKYIEIPGKGLYRYFVKQPAVK